MRGSRGTVLPLLAVATLASVGWGCGDRGRPSETASAGTRGQTASGGSRGGPTTLVYAYRSSFRGWPIAPVHREHPIRSVFLDPRAGGYHFGVDIAVDDLHPELGAPRRRSHRVYAIDSGTASVGHAPGVAVHSCTLRRVGVGQFVYWHVDPTVRDGERVRAGQPIGWTCKGRWHVHLSEWATVDGERTWVNPLHRDGKLAPYSDASAPAIRSVRFVTPGRLSWSWLAREDAATPLRADDLRGRVELRARVEDRESFTGWLARYGGRAIAPNPPYGLAVRITDPIGRVVLSHTAFLSDRLASEPVTVRFAPPTALDAAMWQLLIPRRHVSIGELWFRPFSRERLEYWDTRTVPDGAYSVVVSAWDVGGNIASTVVPVRVANSHPAERRRTT